MSNTAAEKQQKRIRRRKTVRKKVRGTDSRPRLCVFRSARYTYAQLISDETGTTLLALSTRSVAAEGSSSSCVDSAKELGRRLAQEAKKKKIEGVVFDRNGYLYHGRVAAVADGAREAGLNL